ncbi:hypothetical protein A6R68_16763 [Neotoma lepida]|uniref:Uncharacterized protein n=1 Tax=Neotoma lepida TaxID=56216 RepID=A0A1A6HET7_NEOLE|nr:hypothetical protein A6R68_16763 [Neotoma lepida]
MPSGNGIPVYAVNIADMACTEANHGPSFPPLSEYAPPPNPNSDHLVAANPFDDNYSTISYKPLPSSNPYLSPGINHIHFLSILWAWALTGLMLLTLGHMRIRVLETHLTIMY